MLVTSKINIDLRHPNAGVRVDAVQGDVNTRAVEISLFDGGAVWTVPSGVTAALAYKKPDSQQGCLDEAASVTVSGSTITIVMTKQMLAAPGTVNACVVLTDASQNQLTSFPFSVSVAANPAADAQQSDEPNKVDTSDATAAADNIEKGKTAYVNGEKITGSLTLLSSLTAEAEPGFIESTKKVKLTYTNDKKRLIDVNGTIGLTANASNFGDATAEDVAAGKTFTSAAGLKVTGTREDSSSLNIVSDGEGNVTITASGSAVVTSDGEGNVVIQGGSV